MGRTKSRVVAKEWDDFIAKLEKPEQPIIGDRLSFVDHVNLTNPKYQWYRHCKKLANVMQRVADGKLKRLMIFLPPRNGKSELASRHFPAYFLSQHPDRYVGVNSYSADLAYTFSRAARDRFLGAGGKLRPDSASIKQWETNEGGGLWAAGVGGAITGKGFSLGIIDDPLKNQEEAFSEKIRSKQIEWYQSTFYTRAEPDAAIVIILTRWHQLDIAGWLLSQELEEPEHWHIVNFPAIAEQSIAFPETCTIEPDWRSDGQALCPERYDESKLLKIKSKVGSYFWSAMYQQRPTPAEGGLFKRGWWQFYKVLPDEFDIVVQSWDCTFKDADTSDYVVGQVWGRKGGSYYLIDQVRDRMDINSTLVAIQTLSAKYPQARAKLVEDKANGTAVIDLLKRKVSGLIAVNPEGGKVVRAAAISPYVEAGNVYLPDPSIASWVHDLIEEFAAFPNGSFDDTIDSASQAIIWLEKNGFTEYLPQGITRSGVKPVSKLRK